MPVTESYLAEFLSQTTREPDEVLLAMPHLDRECTVRIAAMNAAMAGCRPEYFPGRAGGVVGVAARRLRRARDLARARRARPRCC